MKAYRPRPPHFPGDQSHAEWRDHTLPYVIVAALFVLMITLIVWVVDPAPPKTITISAGPHDSSFLVTADQYKKILARNGIPLKVLEAVGSVQTVRRRLDPMQHVDSAVVHGAAADG